jgi:tRNA (adenine57-N1/adenine58-N1)-methyltransferase catalytic subunit
VDTGSRGRKRKGWKQRSQPENNDPPRASTKEEGRSGGETAVNGGNPRKHGVEEDSEPASSNKRPRVASIEDTSLSSDVKDTPDVTGEALEEEPAKAAVAASSGFVHILKPTPELWTISLPHRTQVVYTPDYSYILQQIRAFPGKSLIEAGAGSGSFTHAAARAVFNGFPKSQSDKKGKVWSFELHEDRYEAMKKEITCHGLDGVVRISHRNVYDGGFLVDGKSPKANAVFLDLPAPWQALPHLSRRKPATGDSDGAAEEEWLSPLDPEQSVYLCTFSPCIEQVQSTVTTLHDLGWTHIEMVELSHKRLIVTREKVGLNHANEKGTLQVPGSVEEAVSRLRHLAERERDFHAKAAAGASTMREGQGSGDGSEDAVEGDEGDVETETISKGEETPQPAQSCKPWMEGNLVHRAEPEIKTHTSYLVFAVLPVEWTEAEETARAARWPVGPEAASAEFLDKAARKKAKREQLIAKKARGS